MIVLTGDTHGYMNGFRLKYLNENERFKDKIDYLIILGDFGLFWSRYGGIHQKNNKFYNFLQEQSYTTLFIDGNHENYDILKEDFNTVEKFGAPIGKYKYSDKIYYLKRGNIYTINNETFFVFGGADSIDKQYRIIGQSWWPEEIPSNDEFTFAIDNLKQYKYSINYVLTHECPLEIYKKLSKYITLQDSNDPVKHMLNYFYNELCISFKKWYFGHYHIDEEIDDKFTCLYKGYVEI